MKIKFGTAPCSWGIWFAENEKQTDWKRCLDEIHEAKYEGIELGPWGYLPNKYQQLKEELKKRNLNLTATTLMDDLTSDSTTEKMIATLDEMAELQLNFSTAQYVVLIDACYTDLFTGELIRPKVLNDSEWDRFVKNINKIKNHAKTKYGLETVFHPHAETHVETEEQIERLLRDTDVKLCLDTGHHAYAGGNPITFMRKHHPRIPYLHIKNCNLKIRERMQKEGWSLAKAVSEDIMCEPELGMVDMKSFFKVLQDVNYNGWAIVEQDMYPAAFEKPLPIAKRTREYLQKISQETVTN
ncbi:sugar phosphate isomerase/epimerase family protein [Priestia megaterium]|uniref:sugar phosphate isomerase/epimerase family protein n=1 Tax=Priestia megaterium TaxID=1404 RepID=UPI0024466090|nr:sugar phosphate isomerase/epimerase [Priestia megaterium]WRQ95544.1 sugar phosphate isomerase/epimerase [Priestia megaterium]